MSTNVTLSLSDALVQRAELWAKYTDLPIQDFLAETIELSLLPLGNAPPPVDEWTDQEVVEAADLDIGAEDDQRLSQLLEQQREDTLSSGGAVEMRRLMQIYQEGILRKAIGLREAVRRGLRDPLES